MANELRDKIGQAIANAIYSGAPEADYFDSREIDRLADAALSALRPLDALSGTEPVILYFGSTADREEFIAAAMEAKPDMRAVSV